MSLNTGTTTISTELEAAAVSSPGERPSAPTATSISDLHKHACWTPYLGTHLDEKGQKLLADLMLMSDQLQYIDSNAQQNRLLQLILFACESLVHGRNTILAKEIHDKVQSLINRSIQHRNKLSYKARNFFASIRSQRIYTVLGLLLFLLGAVILSIFIDIAESVNIVSIPREIFNTAVLFGTLGSSLSIMLRFNEHKVIKSNISYADLFFVGFSKPIIGAVFALVLFAVYKAGVLSLFKVEAADREIYFLIVLFFLAGFSERFVSDMLSRLEGEGSEHEQAR
jgi:hypothetical protein